MDKAKKSFIINVLRRGSYRWYGRWQAEKRSKLGRNEYFCENPTCGVIGPKKDYQMDHIIPVILTTGYDSIDGVADRMYCEPEGFQRLCKDCHRIKTDNENALRPPGERAKSRKKKKQ